MAYNRKFPALRLATSTPGLPTAAVAEAAIEKALANGDSRGNEESQLDALPSRNVRLTELRSSSLLASNKDVR